MVDRGLLPQFAVTPRSNLANNATTEIQAVGMVVIRAARPKVLTAAVAQEIPAIAIQAAALPQVARGTCARALVHALVAFGTEALAMTQLVAVAIRFAKFAWQMVVAAAIRLACAIGKVGIGMVQTVTCLAVKNIAKHPGELGMAAIAFFKAPCPISLYTRSASVALKAARTFVLQSHPASS